MSSFLVAVYWKARADGLDRCAAQLLEHFAALAETSAAFERWFATARTRPKAPREVPVDAPEPLAKLLREGVNRFDRDNGVVVELGWSVGLWNGDREGLAASTNVHCGCTSFAVDNAALLHVSSHSGDPLDRGAAVELLKRLISIWQPDTGVFRRSISVLEEVDLATYAKPLWPWSKPRIRLKPAFFE